jgi:hypothetical protein
LVDFAERFQAVAGGIDIVSTAQYALAAAQDDFLVIDEQDTPFHVLEAI